LPGTCAGLWLKRDDRCATPYGGNKVRKLEFLLADALRHGHDSVFTFGVAGSNHALATAIYAGQLGLEVRLLLTPQSNSSFVGRNLKMGRWAGARQIHCATETDANRAARILRLRGRGAHPPPYRIPGGGSSPLGAVGFVNAGLELAAQVRAGLMPEPDYLYVALGTMGTAAGLALGLAAAGLRTRLVFVRVVRADIASPRRFRALYHGAARLLHRREPRFPLAPLDNTRIEVRHEFIGPGYARFTEEGMAALAMARQVFGIGLEGTYTGKALACLLADLRAGRLAGKHAVFWNTYNGQPLPAEALALDYRELPPAFHRYFETPFQPLDPQA
jgi:1-aminocyclopropane-1-carboxylate deaminase/D-cysteine desulfhydrase-like pyridoxal-dependent ACC family enzyme